MAAPDIVLHCAGIMSGGERAVIDDAIMATNLLGHVPTSVRRLVLVSTAYVYAPAAVNVCEEAFPQPTNVYGHTKLMIESLFTAFAKATHRDLIILRPCAIYGPGDPHGKAITMFVADARDGKPPSLKGPTTFPRDYIHAEDAARSVVAAIDLPFTSGVGEHREGQSAALRTFNVCTGSAWSAVDLANQIATIVPALRMPVDAREADEIGFRFDPSKATRDLGFTADITLEAGLMELITDPIFGSGR
jgi:UDP-glucose 4-epimerase/UDP-glucuronate 4-epimerase